jgi:hypothetical protein
MMFGFLTALPIVGKAFSFIVDKIGGFYLQKRAQDLQAANSHEAKVVEIVKRVHDLDEREAELNAQQNAIDSGGGFYQYGPRSTIGWIVTILLGKVLLWDLAFHQWTGGWTPNPQPAIWQIIMLVIVAFFGTRSIEKVSTLIARLFSGK